MLVVLKTVILYYCILSLTGFVLLLLRDDRTQIFIDIAKGFSKSKMTSILHIFLIFIILPLTIPFSVTRIFNKWL